MTTHKAGEITAQLEELEARWREKGAAIVQHLRPGLTRQEIEQAAERDGLDFKDDLVAWWMWHDGVSDPGLLGGAANQSWIMTFVHLDPLQQALVHRAQALTETARHYGPEEWEVQSSHWRPSMVPIAWGRYPLGAVCATSMPSTAVASWNPGSPLQISARSIGHMLDIWLWALKSGITSVDDSGLLHTDELLLPSELATSGLLV